MSLVRASALADRQHGLLTRAQALSTGLSDDQINHLLQTGRWIRVHRGVYRVAGSPRTFEHRALAACLAAGPGAVVAGRAAAVLWKLLEDVPPRIDLLVPPHRNPRRDGLNVRRAGLRPSDRTKLGPIPIARVHRVLLDLAGYGDPSALETALDTALIGRRTTPEHLLTYIGDPTVRSLRGAGYLRELARDRRDGVPEGALERSALSIIREWRLPKPVRQFRIRLDGRRRRFDLAYPDIRVGIEFDDRAFHERQLRRQDDYTRQNHAELAGWLILRFTRLDLRERRTYVAMTIADALGIRPTSWRRRPGAGTGAGTGARTGAGARDEGRETVQTMP